MSRSPAAERARRRPGWRPAQAVMLMLMSVGPAAAGCIDYDGSLHWAGTASTAGDALDVFVADAHLFVAEGEQGLQIFDLAEPTVPRLVGALDTDGRVVAVVVKGPIAYLAAESAGLLLVDVADVTAPQLLGVFATEGRVGEVAVAGSLVYLADYLTDSISVVDVSDPANPTLVSTLAGLAHPRGVAVWGDYLYVADGGVGLRIIDVSAPSQPVLRATVETPGAVFDVTVDGQLAFVADGIIGGVQVIDVADPLQAQIIGHVQTRDHARRTTLSGDHLLVAGWGAGLETVDVSDPTAPRIVGQVRTYPTEAAGVAVEENHAFVAVGYLGLQIVDITSKESPPALGLAEASVARDAALDGTRAYVTTYDDGLRIFDVSDLASPQYLGGVAFPGQRGKHVAATGPAAVVTSDAGALMVADVADPASAEVVAVITELGAGVDADAVDGRAYVLSGAGLSVIDVAVPAAPEILGTVLVDGSRVAVDASGQVACTIHSALNVVDTSVPEDPRLVASHELPNFPVFYEDVAIAGHLAFASNRDQLVIFDIADPADPWIVAVQETPYSCAGVSAVGDHVYLALNEGGYMVVDVADPAHPVVIGSRVVSEIARNLVARRDAVFVVGDSSTGLHVMPAQCVSILAAPQAPRGLGLLTGIAPNPFNPRTTVSYCLPAPDRVTLSIIDLGGRLVDVLVANTDQPAGPHAVTWDGRGLDGRPAAAGVYLVRLETRQAAEARAVTLIK